MARAANTNIQITDDDTIKSVTVDDTDIADGKALVYNSSSGNLEYETVSGFIPAASRAVYVDGDRVDSYTEDGTVLKPYKTIAAAHSAITDGGSGNRYAIVLMPSDYAENVVMENYVDIVGINKETCRITPTTGTGVAFGGVAISNLYNVSVYQARGSSAAGDCVTATSGVHEIHNCHVEMYRTSGTALHTLIDSTGATIRCFNTTFIWCSDTVAGPSSFYLFNNGTGSTGFYFKDCNIIIEAAFPIHTHYLFNLTSGDESTNIFDGLTLDLGVSTTLTKVFKITSGCTGVTVKNGTFNFVLSGNSHTIYDLDTGTAVLWAQDNHWRFATGGTVIYVDGGSGCTVNSFGETLENIDTFQSSSHTINFAGSDGTGDLRLSGDITDGTNATSATEIKTAYDHSQITGDNPHQMPLGGVLHGFEDRSDTTLSFTDATRTILLGYVSDYTFYHKGTKYTKTSQQAEILPDTTGLHYIYFDSSGTMQSSLASAMTEKEFLIDNVPVATVYWETTSLNKGYISDKRYEITENITTRILSNYECCSMKGSEWVSGLTLGNITADGDGSLAAHLTCSVATGVWSDNGIEETISAIGSPANIPVFYRTGTNGDWRYYEADDYPCRQYLGSTDNRLSYNEYTGSTWQETQVQQNYYVVTHLFATNDPEFPVIGIQGQNEAIPPPAGSELTIAAQQLAYADLVSILSDVLPFGGARPFATIMYETDLAYENVRLARIVSFNAYDYLDIRECEHPQNDIVSDSIEGWSSTSSTSLVTFITRTIPDNFKVGFYRIDWSYVWYYPYVDSEARYWNGQIDLDDDALLMNNQGKFPFYAPSSVPQSSGFSTVYLEPGAEIKFKMNTSNALTEAWIQQLRIFSKRIF